MQFVKTYYNFYPYFSCAPSAPPSTVLNVGICEGCLPAGRSWAVGLPRPAGRDSTITQHGTQLLP